MADIFDAAASTVGDLGALYGRTAAAGGIGHLAAAAGVAYTVVEGCDEQDGCEILGVPLVAELALTPLEVIGVGAQLFGNLNLKSLFGGAVLFLQLGWMP